MAGRPRKLAAVPASAPRKRTAAPQTLQAAADVSERVMLVKLRNMAATQLDRLQNVQDQKASTVAAFAAAMKQFREVDAAIRAIDAKRKQESDEDGEVDPADGWNGEI